MAFEKVSPRQKVRMIARALLAEPDRKPLHLIVREFVTLARRDRQLPRYYFTNFVYRSDAGPAENYLGTRAREVVHKHLGKPYDPALADKLRFHTRAREAKLPIPRLLATIHVDHIEINGEMRAAGDASAVARALNDAREIAARGSIFIKPSEGSGGESCFRIDGDTHPGMMEEVAQRLRGGVFLVQETLMQHPEVARVNPTAVGSLRVHTYREAGGDPRVLSMLMKFPLGNAVVDNASGGGMYAAVDEQTGCVVPPAQTHFQLGARRYDRHPQTDAPLDIALPDWPRLLELVDRAAKVFETPFVGWDIAFTAAGPVLVEGNSVPDLLLAESAARGLRGHPKFWSAIQDAVQPISSPPI